MTRQAGQRVDHADRRRVLVHNAGSTTLKGSVVAVPSPGIEVAEVLAAEAAEPRPPEASIGLEWGDDASRGIDVAAGVERALAELSSEGIEPGSLAGVAHRIVHGGDLEGLAHVVDEGVLAAIDAAAPLAPLHNPVAAEVVRAARVALSGVPHVAVLDTAFHETLPEARRRYPLPESWSAWGLRRHGFHGLSVAWATARAGALLGRPAARLTLVIAHLGSGCSVTAVLGGRSRATSMGLTPLEGLMMGTRAGSIDPGILLAVLRDGRRTVAELAEDLDHRAGLLGVSGRSADLRALQAAASNGDDRASLAIEMFVDRAAAGIAAIATALPVVDALVFSGGIGEHAGAVRTRIVERLAVLGLAAVSSEETGTDRIVAPADRTARRATWRPVVLRIEAREDIVAGIASLAVVNR
jgi:acetate kinase